MGLIIRNEYNFWCFRTKDIQAHIKCPDLKLNDILQIYEQGRLRKCKISTRCNRFNVFYLNGNSKICLSVKLGVGLCISSYKTIYLR